MEIDNRFLGEQIQITTKKYNITISRVASTEQSVRVEITHRTKGTRKVMTLGHEDSTDTQDVFTEVLGEVKKSKNGITPATVRRRLVTRGYSEDKVRSAITKLWDEGDINLGLDRKLHCNEEL